MANRYREQSHGAMEAGDILWYYGTNDYFKFQGQRTAPLIGRSTHDVTDLRYVDNHFLTQGYQIDATPINGRSGQYEYKGAGIAICSDFATLPPSQSASQLRIEGFGKTNPSRPVVDIGVTIAELRDAPSLLNMAGKALIHKGANALLAYQFGWKPLISDLKKLTDLQTDVAKRYNELKRLHSSSGLKRRVSLGSVSSKKDIRGFVCQSTGKLLKIDGSATAERKQWMTVRYKPKAGFLPPKTDQAMLRQAIRATYGLTVDPSTAWNLLPWSWMIDWFSNVGDYLEATRNIVGAECVSCCVMTHESHTIVMNAVNEQGLKGGDHTHKRWSKQRIVGTDTFPEIDLGFGINPYRASILGSLAVNRVPASALYIPTQSWGGIKLPRRK